MEKDQIRVLWNSMELRLNEIQRRQYAATLAKAYGYGGATLVHDITGISLNTITAGKKDLKNQSTLEFGRVRKKGGGRKRIKEKYPNIKEIVRKIINPPAEELDDVFISLIKNALRQMSTDGKIVIRVGAAEYERFFSSGAAEIELDSGITVKATVLRDVSLNDGDCIIDTDDVTINAGIDSQLQYVKIAFERANQYEPD